MPAGKVDRNVLSSNYQDPGQDYLDTKTEGAFEVLAQQIDQNWDDYNGQKIELSSTTPGDSGAHNVGSAPIASVSGLTVYAQLVDLLSKIQSIQNGVVPVGTVTNEMLSGGITEDKLAFATAGSKIYAYRNMGGL